MPPSPFPNDLPLPMQKADPVKRMLALLVDAAIAAILCLIPFLGHLLGGCYLLLRDALPIAALGNRSVGKKLFALGLIKSTSWQNPGQDYWMSIQRNWMFALGPLIYFLVFIPFLGWLLDLLLVSASAIFCIVETVMIFTDPQGIRIGDRMAGTKVIEME